MKRMKTLFIYVILIILFFIFSEIMININLESTYQNIGRKDKLNQVTIHQAQATKINGSYFSSSCYFCCYKTST